MNLAGERVLITGGAGFIGSHLTKTLLTRDAEVHVLDNLFSGRKELVPNDGTVHGTDLRSDELHEIVQNLDPDVVIHLAAIHYVPYCNENPEETFEVNVMGTRNLLKAIGDVADKIVYTSSAAVYPPRETPNSENDAIGPTDIYGKSKLIGEDLTQLHHEDTGVPSVSARLFNVYGPNDTNPHLIPEIIQQLRDGGREVDLGNLEPARDFIHVQDVSRALIALTQGVDEGYSVYNVGSGTEYSVREVVEHVGEALNEDIQIKQQEERRRESDRPHLEADITKIQRDVGWSPEIGFVEGLRGLLEHEDIL